MISGATSWSVASRWPLVKTSSKSRVNASMLMRALLVGGRRVARATGRYSSHPSRLTPDAVPTFTFDGTEAVAFVEVALASMTQTVLLVVAACGLVRDPYRAATEQCWSIPDDSTADLTLAEILAERHRASEISEAWRYERDVVQRRRDEIGVLHSLTQVATLPDSLRR
jgi:hypothetical protein